MQREVDSPAAARRWLGAMLSEVTPRSMDDACLLISELVTNSFIHGGGSPTVRACLGDDELFLSVTDAASARPVPRLLGTADETGGLGLVIVDRLTSSWGVDTLPEGKVVWARMPLT